MIDDFLTRYGLRSGMGDHEFKAKMIRFLGNASLTVGLIPISWFVFDQILIYSDSKYTIPDQSMNFSRLIIGIVITAIAYTSLKWESWHTPNI